MPAYTKLTSRIPLIVAEMNPETMEALEDGAEEIAERARDRVPVRSGKLRDAIHVDVNEDANTVQVIAGDSEAWYGHIVERGSIHAPAQPFLIPAYEAERAGLLKAVADAIDDL